MCWCVQFRLLKAIACTSNTGIPQNERNIFIISLLNTRSPRQSHVVVFPAVVNVIIITVKCVKLKFVTNCTTYFPLSTRPLSGVFRIQSLGAGGHIYNLYSEVTNLRRASCPIPLIEFFKNNYSFKTVKISSRS